jgi:hypothetical protein
MEKTGEELDEIKCGEVIDRLFE